ncbi:Appr-1-p processing protein [Aliikangiella marina]|uniref:Appr-1-p processing protein n=1 Tax=Aliikangiella marina TaxID=1712262 RepID=A0A545T1N7_9GAMM|nr:macro domain-containing protein [Aliikangiella marina]TQV71128.1 Appr-1-p processing protein [Aliikangiella marina]
MSNLPSKIYLIDANIELISAWKEAFLEWSEVEVFHGDFFSFPTDAMVSPANSFGYMDGGLDLAIRYELGEKIETIVQNMILDKHYGELPVGLAEIVETEHDDWPFLICAPTMRVPKNISNTLNAYLAFRAILTSVIKHNLSSSSRKIDSLVCPGLGTGVGSLPPKRCAQQMKMAYHYATQEPRISGFNEAHTMELQLTQL